MDILQATILGIVEGLTEYLPISSTGHLIIAQYLLGMEESPALSAFEICIQGGAILAVLGLYFPRVAQMWRGLLGHCPEGRQLLINLLIAFIPAAIVGLLCSHFIKAYLFNAPTVTVSWALGGIAILIYVRSRARASNADSGVPLEALSRRGALGIGLMQCIAMCPGVSRSLMTMLGGLCVGLRLAAAVEFSFLLGLITLGAATCHDAAAHGSVMLRQLGWLPMLTGTLVAWGCSLIAVKWMVSFLRRHSLSIFGWYRLAAAALMLYLISCGLGK